MLSILNFLAFPHLKSMYRIRGKFRGVLIFVFFVGNVKTTKIYTLLITVITFVSHQNDKQLMMGLLKQLCSEVRSYSQLFKASTAEQLTSRFYARDHGWLIAIPMIFLTSHSNGESADLEAQTLADMSPSSKAARNPLDT